MTEELIKLVFTAEDKEEIRSGLKQIILDAFREDIHGYLSDNYLINYEDLFEEIMNEAKDDVKEVVKKIMIEKLMKKVEDTL